MSDLYNINDNIRNTVNRLLMDVHTTIPAKVTAYNSLAQTVDVKIAVNRPTVNGENIPAGTYHDIPMMFPAAGKWVIAGPMEAGDTVLLLVPHYGTQEFMSGDGIRVGDPENVVMHDMNDAVAIPGLFTQGKPTIDASIENSLYLKYGDTTTITLSDTQCQITTGATVFTQTTAGVSITGNLTVSGVVQGATVQTATMGLATHTHAYVDTGNTPTAQVTAIGLG